MSGPNVCGWRPKFYPINLKKRLQCPTSPLELRCQLPFYLSAFWALDLESVT